MDEADNLSQIHDVQGRSWGRRIVCTYQRKTGARPHLDVKKYALFVPQGCTKLCLRLRRKRALRARKGPFGPKAFLNGEGGAGAPDSRGDVMAAIPCSFGHGKAVQSGNFPPRESGKKWCQHPGPVDNKWQQHPTLRGEAPQRAPPGC